MQEIFQLKDGRQLVLRTIQETDYKAVQVYLKQLAKETIFTNQYPNRPEKTQEEFNKMIQRSWFMMAMDGDQVAGFISTHILHSDHPWRKHICSFGCHMLKQYTHQGLGHKFMDLMEQWAKENHIHRIEGSVREKNIPAIGLYLKHGFVLEGLMRDKACINGVWHNEYMISKMVS